MIFCQVDFTITFDENHIFQGFLAQSLHYIYDIYIFAHFFSNPPVKKSSFLFRVKCFQVVMNGFISQEIRYDFLLNFYDILHILLVFQSLLEESCIIGVIVKLCPTLGTLVCICVQIIWWGICGLYFVYVLVFLVNSIREKRQYIINPQFQGMSSSAVCIICILRIGNLCGIAFNNPIKLMEFFFGGGGQTHFDFKNLLVSLKILISGFFNKALDQTLCFPWNVAYIQLQKHFLFFSYV